MKSSGSMEQLCWNAVFMQSMIMDPKKPQTDPFCWWILLFPPLSLAWFLTCLFPHHHNCIHLYIGCYLPTVQTCKQQRLWRCSLIAGVGLK